MKELTLANSTVMLVYIYIVQTTGKSQARRAKKCPVLTNQDLVVFRVPDKLSTRNPNGSIPTAPTSSL